MPGVIIPNTPIAVDFWGFRPGLKLYFLTHMHADHTGGLSSSWNHGTIFATPDTAALLIHKFRVEPSIVRTFKLGDTIRIPMDPSERVVVQVTAIDANHCPGAAMFLFEGYFGTVLCTGDFRYHPDMLNLDCLRDKHIDLLYLDNTYADRFHEFLPPREECARQIHNIIDRRKNWRVKIATDTLGKEELLIFLAEQFSTKIIVTPHRFGALRALGMEQYFTTDPKEGFIEVARKTDIHSRQIDEWNKESDTVAILASALYGQRFWRSKYLCIVPYTLHSSFLELKRFVKALRPSRLLPIVAVPDRLDFEAAFAPYLTPENESQYRIPRGITVAHAKISVFQSTLRARAFHTNEVKEQMRIYALETEGENTEVDSLGIVVVAPCDHRSGLGAESGNENQPANPTLQDFHSESREETTSFHQGKTSQSTFDPLALLLAMDE
eukprot:Clim_evm15s241 gene=Clim_evmTU15s241